VWRGGALLSCATSHSPHVCTAAAVSTAAAIHVMGLRGWGARLSCATAPLTHVSTQQHEANTRQHNLCDAPPFLHHTYKGHAVMNAMLP
jgi:hypothetical protein